MGSSGYIILFALFVLVIIPWITRQRKIAAVRHILNQKKQHKEDSVMKELAKQFSQIPEIGKFKAIKVPVVLDELKAKQAKATISIEPSVLPNDFRTRVLTFTLKSNSDKGIVQEMSPASGNKFSIESTLKNPQIIKIFTDFIKEAGI